jgi:hypothetical protein
LEPLAAARLATPQFSPGFDPIKVRHEIRFVNNKLQKIQSTHKLLESSRLRIVATNKWKRNQFHFTPIKILS